MARHRHSLPTEPKPFFWIPAASEINRDRPPAHDHFQGWSGRLDLEIKVISQYLYVGSGLVDLDEQERAYYTFARRNGQLIIPGTGIKGPVRSIVEAISNSCVSQVTGHERNKTRDRCTGTQQRKAVPDRLCPACRLFGTTGYGGRLHFMDAVIIEDTQTEVIKIADLWPPRQVRGRKFYQVKQFQQPDNQQPERNHRFLEALPKETRFNTSLHFNNLTTAEMGLLARALGWIANPNKENSVIFAFPVKLGGAKPRCLGAVYFYPKAIQTLPIAKNELFQALSTGGQTKSVTSTLLEWLNNIDLLNVATWEPFKEEGKKQDEVCPKELY